MTNFSGNTWEEKEKKNRRKGLITSIAIHTVLLILFIFLGLSSAFPPPTQGILINFGRTETGRDNQPSEVKEKVEEVAPAEAIPQPPIEAAPAEAQEEVVTQDVVEAPSIEKEEEPEVKPEVKEEKKVEEVKPEEPVKEAEKPVEEVKETEPKPEPKPVVDPRALFTGEQSDVDNPSDEGITGEKGDQGVETGDISSDNYEGDVSYGLGNTGVGYDLAGRELLSIPPVNDQSQETGKVAVRIKVDRNGKVLYAKYTAKGSTTTDAHLIALAEEAARKAKFSTNTNAPEEQFGTITFTFKLK